MRGPGPELERIRSDAWEAGMRALVDPDEGWYWESETPPDLDLVQMQYEGLLAALESEGVAIHFAEPADLRFSYTRDPLVTVPGGAIIGRMGPRMRRGEEPSIARAVASLGMPVLRTITGTGLMEGGSFAKLTPAVAAFGTSIRCNNEGARQLADALRPLGVELLIVPMSGFSIHLDGDFAMATSTRLSSTRPGFRTRSSIASPNSASRRFGAIPTSSGRSTRSSSSRGACSCARAIRARPSSSRSAAST